MTERLSAPLEVTCPACGGLVEATTEDELVQLVADHCLSAHGYSIRREHVLAALITPKGRDA